MSGQQLAQTVFTCLYLHQQLTLIRNPYLMIYAHCILRHVSQYRAMILAADVFHVRTQSIARAIESINQSINQ